MYVEGNITVEGGKMRKLIEIFLYINFILIFNVYFVLILNKESQKKWGQV